MVIDRYRSCAFCHRLDADLVYYAMRHYAHGACLIEAWPLPRLLGMKTFPLSQLPALTLRDYGYLDAIATELKRRIADA